MFATKTSNASTGYVVEFYPFANADPDDDETGLGAGLGVDILSSSEDISDIISDIKKSGVSKDVSGKVTSKAGLVNLGFSRSKGSPAGQCSFTFIGAVPNSVVIGTWVVVSRVIKVKSGKDWLSKSLIRFIGCITNVEPTYSKHSTGLLTVATKVTVREWSSSLMMPIRFDLLSIFAKKDDLASAAALVGALGKSMGDPAAFKDLDLATQKRYSPFELAALILAAAGALNTADFSTFYKDDKKEAYESVKKLSDIALTTPSVPSSILARIGAPDADPENPFTSDFVTMVIGAQTGANSNNSNSSPGVYNGGGWNGLFQKDGVKNYKNNSFDKNPDNRGAAAGFAAVLGMGNGAYSLIQNYCDAALNEFFTDIWYEIDEGKNVLAKPVIVFRDKPLLMRSVIKEYPDLLEGVNLDKWSKYDDLPRVRINSANITNVSIGQTSVNSPNLIRCQVIDANLSKSVSVNDNATPTVGTQRLEKQMRRFGGQDHYLETNFIFNSKNNKKFDEWIKEVKVVSTYWHAFSYRFGYGMISMKDDGSAISVGFNVQFEFQGVDFVGHVDAIEMSFSVNPETGMEDAMVNLTLSRIVMVHNNELKLIPMKAMNKLHLLHKILNAIK